MPEVDAELFEMLSKTYQERMLERKQEQAEKTPISGEKQRKLDRLKRIREKESLIREKSLVYICFLVVYH